jgi:8-oxo-dGTP diphosphatase
MEKEHRISAGAIVVRDERILLVKYESRDGKFLVGPGGRVENDEGVNQTVVREVREETGLEVKPLRILFVEDLLWQQFRMLKVWFLCEITGGELSRTQGAIDEGITEAGWYSREQLRDEVVYPPVLLSHKWDSFFEENREAEYLELRNTKSNY